MNATPSHDKSGHQIVDAYDDRCPRNLCRSNALNLYRCVSCVFFDPRGRCLHEGNRAGAADERKEDRHDS